MVASGLCTDSQYESGVIKLVDFMACTLEHFYGRKHVVVVSGHKKVNNSWGDEQEVVFQSPSDNNAAKQIEVFHQFAQGHYRPKMTLMKTLGMYDANVHPKSVLIYLIGTVVNRG